MSEFEVFVSKADFRFHCAHFIAYEGFRERLHGHNYQVSVKVTGDGAIGNDGYLIDFGDIKKATRAICSSMNEYFICPMKSPSMKITETETQICLDCEDGSHFVFPRTDCKTLPILHSSAEEMAHYVYCQIIRKIGLEQLHVRGIKVMEVGVAEAVNQTALYRAKIPKDEEDLYRVENTPLNIRPKPCLEA